jgi:type IX secretion system PorP/SprF family membrane protein
MKKVYFIFSLLVVGGAANAQQIGMFSHYFYKPMVYNPAFTGASDGTNAMIISRSQWTDFKNSPQLNVFSLDGNLMENKVGVGLNIISDRKGLSNRIGGNVFYSYRLNINEDMYLRFGVSAGVFDQSIDYTKAQVENSADPTLFGSVEHKTTFDGNAGLLFGWKGLEFGAAVPQLIGNKVNYVDNENVRAYYSQARHYMGSLKYKFFINKEKGISIAPLGLVRFIPNTPFQYDGNINFDWQDKFWIGATYKSDYAVGANVGFCVHKQFYVGYSYDFIIGSIANYAGTSHELMVNFKFGKNKKQEEPVAKAKVEEQKALENAAYVKRMDSLQTQLAESNKKMQELADKLEQQAKMQAQAPANPSNTAVAGNQNATVTEGNPNRKSEDGILFVTNKKTEFKDVNNNSTPGKGFYVVIGTYFYQDLAMAEAKRFRAKGYSTTDWVYSGPKGYNYIFMYKTATKEEAISKLKLAKEAGVKDAWVQIMED